MNRFPTNDEFENIQTKYLVTELDLIPHDKASCLTPSADVFFGKLEINDWLLHLSNRMIQARDAYHLMMFYFDRGIPDRRPYESPGRSGASIDYFPDFTDEDHLNKARFDFYVDTFCYKLFSAWDTVGQLLNVTYQLKLKSVSFEKVIQAFEKQGVPLGTELRKLIAGAAFEQFRRIRHDTTHNFPPSMFGGVVTRSDNGEKISFGVGSYVSAAEIVDAATKAMRSFDTTLRIIGVRS